MSALLEAAKNYVGKGFTFFQENNCLSVPTAVFKAPKLKRIIELAEANNLEVEQLKQQPDGSPEPKRELLELSLWRSSHDTLAHIATTMFIGKRIGYIIKSVHEFFMTTSERSQGKD